MGIIYFNIVIFIIMVSSVLYFALSSKYAKKTRVIAITFALLISHSLVGVYTYAVHDIDCNSYYNATISVLLDTTIAALEAEDPSFLNELKEFQSEQSLSYETRGNILQNTEDFRSKTVSRYE